MFGHTGVGSTVTDTDMNDGQAAGSQPAEGKQEDDDEQISRSEHVDRLRSLQQVALQREGRGRNDN